MDQYEMIKRLEIKNEYLQYYYKDFTFQLKNLKNIDNIYTICSNNLATTITQLLCITRKISRL